MTKYDFDIPSECFNTNITRLTNQLWKLIPMKENNENWQKQLDTVIVEVAGLQGIFKQEVSFLQLLSKLEGIRTTDLTFNHYRKNVFESISLLQECGHELH